MAPLLGKRGIVDDQPGAVTADHLVGLNEQRGLQWRAVPHASGNKMVKLVVGDARIPYRHRLNALAIAGAN